MADRDRPATTDTAVVLAPTAGTARHRRAGYRPDPGAPPSTLSRLSTIRAGRGRRRPAGEAHPGPVPPVRHRRDHRHRPLCLEPAPAPAPEHLPGFVWGEACQPRHAGLARPAPRIHKIARQSARRRKQIASAFPLTASGVSGRLPAPSASSASSRLRPSHSWRLPRLRL